MLDEKAPADGFLACLPEQPADNFQLVPAGPDDATVLAVGGVVFLYDHLRIVLEYVAQALFAQYVLPEIGRLQAVGIDGIAGAAVYALVEGQEPTVAPAELGAHVDGLLVGGEVHGTAFGCEDQFAGVAAAVLGDGVGGLLVGVSVLQLEGDDGQAVNEEGYVEREGGVGAGVVELANDAEAVLEVEGFSAFAQGGGQGGVKVEGVAEVLHAVAQDVHHAALGKLVVDPFEELAPAGVGGEDA